MSVHRGSRMMQFVRWHYFCRTCSQNHPTPSYCSINYQCILWTLISTLTMMLKGYFDRSCSTRRYVSSLLQHVVIDLGFLARLQAKWSGNSGLSSYFGLHMGDLVDFLGFLSVFLYRSYLHFLWVIVLGLFFLSDLVLTLFLSFWQIIFCRGHFLSNFKNIVLLLIDGTSYWHSKTSIFRDLKWKLQPITRLPAGISRLEIADILYITCKLANPRWMTCTDCRI